MDQTPGTRRSIWRFSLRELFLLMLAAAAFIGWGALLYRSGQLKPTPFFTANESWRQDVIAIFQELGEPPFADAWGTTMHSEGPSSVQRTIMFQIPLPPEKKQAFLRALARKVSEKMTKEGCRSTGGAEGSSSITSVSILGYQRGPVAGTVQICVMEAADDKVGVVVTMQEGQGQGQGGMSFGLQTGD